MSDLGNDRFITLLYQYLATPGVVISTPLTGRYTKGMGADVTATFHPPLAGDTNMYFGQLDIFLAVLQTAAQPGLGGGGDGPDAGGEPGGVLVPGAVGVLPGHDGPAQRPLGGVVIFMPISR